jgi:hypothetical protein
VEVDRGVTATYIQARPLPGALDSYAKQATEGELQIEVSANYPFAEITQALSDFEGKHFPGKVTISF